MGYKPTPRGYRDYCRVLKIEKSNKDRKVTFKNLTDKEVTLKVKNPYSSYEESLTLPPHQKRIIYPDNWRILQVEIETENCTQSYNIYR